jgi:hypothetical protein
MASTRVSALLAMPLQSWPCSLEIKGQLQRLIIQMYNENAGWGAGRIQGELLKLGYNVTKRTVAKYLAMYPLTPTPG